MTYVGSVQSTLNTYDELNKKAIETATKGIGRLVDAAMDEKSVKLKALETQQQLATQGFQIANAQPANIYLLDWDDLADCRQSIARHP